MIFSNILFPVDLSETSNKIAKYVKEVGDKFEARIHLLFVARELNYFMNMHVPSNNIDRFQEALLAGAKVELKKFKTKHFNDDLRIRCYVTSGDIAEEILSYIESHGIDTIIMGTHGRKGLEKIFFGSVAERVAKVSPVPVLLINPYRLPQKIIRDEFHKVT